jgi:hypothetical protein
MLRQAQQNYRTMKARLTGRAGIATQQTINRITGAGIIKKIQREIALVLHAREAVSKTSQDDNGKRKRNGEVHGNKPF